LKGCAWTFNSFSLTSTAIVIASTKPLLPLKVSVLGLAAAVAVLPERNKPNLHAPARVAALLLPDAGGSLR
jgi:hypothetical protein